MPPPKRKFSLIPSTPNEINLPQDTRGQKSPASKAVHARHRSMTITCATCVSVSRSSRKVRKDPHNFGTITFQGNRTNRGFHQQTKLAIMPILASEALLLKKIQLQNVMPSDNRTWASHSLWFQVQHYPFYTNLTSVFKTPYIVMLYWFSLNHLIPNIKWCPNRSLKIS